MTRTTINLALICAAMLAISACGTDQTVDPPVGPVAALNLQTGETKTFPSGEEVPPGWAACTDPTCADMPWKGVPCQNLGTKVCSLNPNCRLKEVGCSSAGCAGPGCPPPPPPTCTYTCLPKKPLLCEELGNQGDCSARSDCSWGAGMCPMAPCSSDGDCPPCPEICQPKAPATCDSLDEKNCQQRSDCDWEPKPCLFWCPAGAPDCCGSFCRDKQTKVCPTQTPPPAGFCANGKIVPKYDENNCVIGFKCVKKECPPVQESYPYCPDGTVVPKYDENGCMTGYECKNSKTGCDALAKAYGTTLAQAKQCAPYAFAPQCTTTVSSALACGCPTHVNASRKTEIDKLAALKIQWDAKQCGLAIACPAMPCWAPKGGTCKVDSSGQSGSCEDINN